MEAEGFQSTRPLRGATQSASPPLICSLFQSTRPLRGATEIFNIARRRDDISIHAPLAGRDG